MKTKRLAVFGLAVVSVALLLASCPNPIGSSASRDGSLSIHFTNSINARTLLPPIDMTAASFTVNGSGPGGATFSQTSTGGSVTVTSLAFGNWSVTVNALNAAGTVIGSGQATVTVHTGETTTVDISIVPLSGNGTLNLTVSWTAAQVEIPSILATLTPPSGTPMPLSFSVTGNQAAFSSTTIPAGYQTLTLQVLDNNLPVMGAVEVARIVAGQTTTGSYAFTNVNQPGGSIQVNITPAMADPIPVSISGVASTITAGTSITASPLVSDGTTGVVYVWYLNGVSQATGSTYTFGSSLAAGYYRLDVTAYTADGTRAGSATASFQVVPVTAPASAGRFVFVTDYIGGAVSGYSIGYGGLLTSLSYPATVSGAGPQGIAVTPNGSFLYVDNFESNTMSAYAVGIGGLTPLSTPTYATGSNPCDVAITPNGSFLYVANESGGTSGTISAYAISSKGLLTPLSTPTVGAGSGPYGIAITPNGSFLYVTNWGSNTVSAYSVGSDGLLHPLSTAAFEVGKNPEKIAISPNGSFLYVTNWTDNTVSAFAIGSGGELTPLGTPTFPTGLYPWGIATTPSGSFLYVTNVGDKTMSAYAIGPDGLLNPLVPPVVPAGGGPYGIAVAPSGSVVYVANNWDSTVSAYAIGSNGLLTPVGVYVTGAFPAGIVVVP